MSGMMFAGAAWKEERGSFLDFWNVAGCKAWGEQVSVLPLELWGPGPVIIWNERRYR